MPKDHVSDPITDQEMAFALLILSGTMNDRRAAEAVGLNPDAAADTSARPRVRAYMVKHSAAVEEKLVDQQAEGRPNQNLGRDQILARLWELASLSPEATRNNIAGQIKALAMIVAIEGLVPDRRLSPPAKQAPVVPPFPPNVYRAAWLREQQSESERTMPGEANGAPEAPAPPVATQPPVQQTPPEASPNGSGPLHPVIQPERTAWVPDATGFDFTAALGTDRRRPFSPPRGFSGRRR